VTALRQRMIDDLRLRNRSPRTIEAYVGWVARLARFHGRSPDQIGAEQVRAFLLHLLEQKVAWSTYTGGEKGTQLFSVGMSASQQLRLLFCPRRRSAAGDHYSSGRGIPACQEENKGSGCFSSGGTTVRQDQPELRWISMKTNLTPLFPPRRGAAAARTQRGRPSAELCGSALKLEELR
jgi:hypothetical protein